MATAVRSEIFPDPSTPAPAKNPAFLKEKPFRPGEAVPSPGTFWVCHYKHREVHASKVRFTLFPECAQCGSRVRFFPATPEKGRVADWLRRDPDFRQALKPLRRQRPRGNSVAR